MEEILKQMAGEGLQVNLTYFPQSYMAGKRWHLDISQDEGIQFRLANQATSLEEVVRLAYERWLALRDRGLYAAMSVPALPPPEAPPSPPPSPSDAEMKAALIDDEIPF